MFLRNTVLLVLGFGFAGAFASSPGAAELDQVGIGKTFYCKCKDPVASGPFAIKFTVEIRSLVDGAVIDDNYSSSEFHRSASAGECSVRVSKRHNNIYDIPLCILPKL